MTPAEVDPRVARTQEVVVDATAELLAEMGFERICIDAIAKRSGVARSTIYRNWPQRATLLAESFGRICAKGPADLEPTGCLRDDLRALAERLISQLCDDDWGRAAPSLIGAAARDPDLATVIATFSAQRAREAMATLERAVEAGEITRPERIELALERFVAPFFVRRLITHRPLDDDFVTAQIEATLAELGAT